MWVYRVEAGMDKRELITRWCATFATSRSTVSQQTPVDLVDVLCALVSRNSPGAVEDLYWTSRMQTTTLCDSETMSSSVLV